MAYVSADLNCISPRLGTSGAALWTYRSAADAVGTIVGAGHISDGIKKGLKVNDVVIVIDDVTTVDLCVVTAISAAGAVTMVNGT